MLLTTVATDEEAERLARGLLEEKLAACVQLSHVVSHYEWQGEPTRSDEVLLLIKTLAAKTGAVSAYLLANHSYTTPELVEIPITSGLPGYLRWVEEAVQ